MTNSFFHFIICLALVPVFSGHAFAQRCRTDYEMILEMREGDIGSYNVWDAVHGDQHKDERFVSGVLKESGKVVVAGERFLFEDGAIELILVEFDKRGRDVWEKEYEIKGLRQVKKMLKHKNGFVVLANKQAKDKKSSVWLGFFDSDGQKLGEKSISPKSGSLVGQDLIQAQDGKSYQLVASFDQNIPGTKGHTIIYKVNDKGAIIDDHAYAPGLENKILGISAHGDSGYIAVGYIYGEDGRKTGWIMSLNEEGSIIWQRQYPRGRAAILVTAHDFLENYVIVAGYAHPAARGNVAGWVMMVQQSNGDIAWQRYYRGEMAYQAKDILVSEDGLISVLLEGQSPAGENKQGFVRLLTLNPRGAMFISDEYLNAEGTAASQILMGPVQERILIGSSRMTYQIEKLDGSDEPPEILRSLDGWVLAATATEPYTDPCLQPYSFLP